MRGTLHRSKASSLSIADGLRRYFVREIESLALDEQTEIEGIFDDFERVLGPVGAAKALHLLARRFFPLWGRPIASGCSFWLGKRDTNANRYGRWMLRTRRECHELGGETAWGPGLLKRIDEFNYWRYTLGGPRSADRRA